MKRSHESGYSKRKRKILAVETITMLFGNKQISPRLFGNCESETIIIVPYRSWIDEKNII